MAIPQKNEEIESLDQLIRRLISIVDYLHLLLHCWRSSLRQHNEQVFRSKPKYAIFTLDEKEVCTFQDQVKVLQELSDQLTKLRKIEIFNN